MAMAADLLQNGSRQLLSVATTTPSEALMAATPVEIDPQTPVLVGVGQSSERPGDPGYQALSPISLAVAAAAEALRDTGLDPATLAKQIDVVVTTRQFENSTPGAPVPFGKSSNFPRSVAERLGADPARAVLDVVGGNGPQKLVAEFAGEIAAGRATCVLIAGAEAISTARHLAETGQSADWSDDPAGELEDRGFGLAGMITWQDLLHGLVDAPAQYGLVENARRGRLGLSTDAYAASMGELFAPFTTVAAGNPHAVFRDELDGPTLAGVDERNRVISSPYPRFLVSRDLVNQGAALLLTSVGEARRLGIAEDKLVYLAGHADVHEPYLLERPELSTAPSAGAAIRHALQVADTTLEAIGWFDLYSCFPVAVSNVLDDLGLAPDDPRGFTLTGGLPFFGGAGNNYSTHAIAEAVGRARSSPGSLGLVGANGGVLTKYSVGVYTTTPSPWHPSSSQDLQDRLDLAPRRAYTDDPNGWARIDTWTVRHGKRGRHAIVVGTLESDGRRFVATVVPGDDALLDLLDAAQSPVGKRIWARRTGPGNRVALSPEDMERLLPTRPVGFRDSYEHILLERRGRVLEVTINRPQVRNALHPPANEELSQVFDAYFADPELWVAIICGAGEESFCAGNDLIYSASGRPMYVPPAGFGGLTARQNMTKPVIAAINGFAMGGGFEIALACHLIVADEKVTLALSEVRVGLFAAAGGLTRLPERLPPNVATELILTGRRMGAEEAQGWGLVNRVAPAGEALAAARELAEQIITGSPTSVRLSLQVMAQNQSESDGARAHAVLTRAIDELMVSADMSEGMAAFAQKRPPAWKNR
jgi:acetyl-CoA C-acetyltransferase